MVNGHRGDRLASDWSPWRPVTMETGHHAEPFAVDTGHRGPVTTRLVTMDTSHHGDWLLQRSVAAEAGHHVVLQ